ncbi:MAG: PTS sugar transporter subunit IIA [Gemmatimonadota bacterium]
MQITVRQAATYLGVDEATVRKWIRERDLPAHRVNERLHLNAIEVWEWAVAHGVPASRRLLEEAQRAPEDSAPLSQLLEAGGIHTDVEGDTKSAALGAVIERLPLSPDVDRRFLLSVLDAREAMGSTGVGDGIAIPHVRNPILLHVDRAFVSLCLLRHPVEFGAIDGKPVHALFFLVAPTIPSHLRMLAQLGFVLRDPWLRRLLRDRAPATQILGRIRELEVGHTGSYPLPPGEKS